MRYLVSFVAVSLFVAACSSAEPAPVGHDTPEQAVVSWFEAVDSGDVDAASESIDHTSLALILGIENALPIESTIAYLTDGVPIQAQETYWESFAEGFRDFAARPISTLTVGQAAEYKSEGQLFAVVPISGGPDADSVVISRMRPDGSWEVDMVATLGDGFVTLLQSAYVALPPGAAGDTVRAAYVETVVPSMWAAMAEGSFGDDFARSALSLIERIELIER